MPSYEYAQMVFEVPGRITVYLPDGSQDSPLAAMPLQALNQLGVKGWGLVAIDSWGAGASYWLRREVE